MPLEYFQDTTSLAFQIQIWGKNILLQMDYQKQRNDRIKPVSLTKLKLKNMRYYLSLELEERTKYVIVILNIEVMKTLEQQ